MKLLPRVALALGAVGLLPVAIASLGLVDVNRAALTEQVLRTHILAARTGADRIGSFLATRLSLAQGAAGNPALADPQSAAAQELLLQNLGAWADLGVQAAVVVNARGEEVIRAQLKGEDVPRRVAAALRLGSKDQVAAVPGEQPPVLRIAAALPEGTGSLVLVCDGAALADVVHPVELGDQASLLVVDPQGGVVLGSAASLEGLPRDLVQTAFSGKVDGSGRFPAPGGEILAAYTAVPQAGWTVLSRQPAAIAEAVAARMRRRSALAVGAALLLIGGLSAVAYVSVVRPVRDLVAAQRDLAKVEGGTGGGDEIKALRITFDALRRSLYDRNALDQVFLGRYQVLEVLGTGGMGTVFRGIDPKLQRPVALKTIRLGGDFPAEKRQEMIATLLREAVTVAQLSHPNVVAVYDLEDAPEAAFVAMELVDGMSLERLLFRSGRLSSERVVPLGAALARGIAAAHARGILHRDIKPANVLLGKDGSIKVGDFGIAGLIAAAGLKRDTVFGTPGYLPPESLKGEGSSASGDLFALGVVLYECLTGVQPFQGVQVADIVQATLFGRLRSPRDRVPAVPPMLDALVLRLLDKDPANRPADAAAVAAELDRMAAERGLRWTLEPADAAPVPSPPAGGTVHAAQWIPTTRISPVK